MKKIKQLFVCMLLLSGLLPSVQAGVYTDDLSRCLVESSSQQDKLALVRWMFSAMSLHPHVEPFANITAEQREQFDKGMANVFTRLMTQTCLQQTRKAVQYEGAIAIQSSFKILGQVAARELFAHPRVAAGLAGLEKHVDSQKLQDAIGLKK